MLIEGKPGPSVLQDGALSTVRLGRDGATATQDAHGRYTEATARGVVFWQDSATVTLAAANTSAGALGTIKLINGFWNPQGSGKNCFILSVAVTYTSGTATGAIVYNYLPNVVLSNAVTGTIQSGFLGAGATLSVVKAETGVILASNTPLATSVAIQLGVVGLQGAGVATPTGIYEEVAGRICVPPGTVFGLAQIGAGTGVVQSTMSWEELPV